MNCTHDISEREVATAADGLCPLCLEVEVGRLLDALTRLKFDLDETLKAVLHHFGPSAAHTVASHVLMARRSRDSNAEIDELEKLFGPIATGKREKD